MERMLSNGERLPDSSTFPEVGDALSRGYPPRARQGFTIFLTGLSGAGKSTIANALRIKLLERGGRAVTLLDGDLVRKQLSPELGFSREHRELNIRRIALMAAEVTKSGGAVICAAIAPYASIRREARHTIESAGGFVLVFVDTPLELCERRDPKGHYAKARAGLIEQFTGVSDVYEPPSDADVIVRTAEISPEQASERILAHLESAGYLTPGDSA